MVGLESFEPIWVQNLFSNKKEISLLAQIRAGEKEADSSANKKS